jgi:hypothetical protein
MFHLKAFRVCVALGLFYASLFANDDLGSAKVMAQDVPATIGQDMQELKLSSGFFATPISLHQRRPGTITSFKLVANLASRKGSGVLELNQTALKFNDFGDFEVVGAHQSESIPVQFIQTETVRDEIRGRVIPTDDPQRSLVTLILPEGFFNLSLVVPKSSLKDCHLIVSRDSSVINRIPLSHKSLSVGDPQKMDSNDSNPMTDSIDLSSEYVFTEIGFKEFRIQGVLGSQAKFYLNPNHQGFNAWGDEGMSTLLAWQPRSVDLQLKKTPDPQGKGRKQFELVTNGPRQTRYFLIHSPLEHGHRLVIKRDESVIHVVPMRASAGSPSE